MIEQYSENEQPEASGPSIWALTKIAYDVQDEQIAHQLGTINLYKHSQRLPEYPAARKAWFAAWRLFSEKQNQIDAFPRKANLTWDEQKRVAISILRNARSERGFLLHQFASLVWLAAKKGDASFFRELGAAIEASDEVPDSEGVPLHLLTFWFSGLLWLMSASERAAALKRYCGRDVESSACTKAAKRLGLLDYRVFSKSSPISYFDEKRKQFVFQQSWTSWAAVCPS